MNQYAKMLTVVFCWIVGSFVTFILCLSVFYKSPLKGTYHSYKCILNVYLKLNFKRSQKDKHYVIKCAQGT